MRSHTSRVITLISKERLQPRIEQQQTQRPQGGFASLLFILVFTTVSLSGCALLSTDDTEPKPKLPVSQTFVEDFNLVWQSLRKAMLEYPVMRENFDSGVIETETLKGTDMWRPPFVQPDRRNLKYSLAVQAIRGEQDGKTSAQIVVNKNITFKRDFFSDDTSLRSDGWEEKWLLYRVGREIAIENSLNKALQNPTPNLPEENPPDLDAEMPPDGGAYSE